MKEKDLQKSFPFIIYNSLICNYLIKQSTTMKIIINFVLLVVIVLGLTTCTYNNEEVLYSNSNDSCDTTNITFKTKVTSVFSRNCLACHGNSVAANNGGGIRLQDYNDVKAILNNAYGSMAHLPGYPPMPKGMSNTIDACDIKTVRIWKEAGAPNN